MSTPKNTCQSCGMPLSKDPHKGGSETDGSRSFLYCSYCYENGTFTQPDATCQEMIAKVTEVMQTKMGIPRIFHWLVARWVNNMIPQLARWKQQ